MTYPVFSAGEVLRAEDMNAVGLWLVKTQTVGAGVSSVPVTGAFSAEYDNYLVQYTGGVGSTTVAINLQLGPSSVSGFNTGYYLGLIGSLYGSGTANFVSDNNASSWQPAAAFAEGASVNVTLLRPHDTVRTGIVANRIDYRTSGGSVTGTGFHNSTNSFTDFTLSVAGGATLTGGIIRVYGFKD